MNMPTRGSILIAEPFLKDPPFKRSVVLICEHAIAEGTFGFMLNRKLNTKLHEIVSELDDWPLPVYYGGPVQIDTVHYIHQYPQYFTDAVKITDNVYWGGDFELVKKLIKNGTIDSDKIKFFLGYSGWSKGQLEEEIEEKTWIIAGATKHLIFDTHPSEVWNASLTKLGGKYKMMINFPTDPQLN
jgi:putative transcriptional regulator